MTTRFTANLVLGCALSAVTAGCTVHTYSARPEYPSTVFVSHGSSARDEASFHTERSRDRATYRRDDDDRPTRPVRPTRTTARERTANRRDDNNNAKNDNAKPDSHASAKPSRTDGSAEKPRTGTKNDGHVVLMPPKPEPAKPEKQRTRLLSIRERLERHVKKTDAEVAQKERERRRRMNGAIGAASDKRD